MSLYNITTVVGTCDSYLKYLPNFFSLFEKYVDLPVDTIVCGETIPLEKSGRTRFLTPGKLPWGARMLAGLNEVRSEYTLFLLEDYYVSQTLTAQFFNWLVSFCDTQKANKIIMSVIGPEACYEYTNKIDTMYRMSCNSPWLASLQPSLWRTSHLKKLMDPSYSPWDFEIKASSKLLGIEHNHYAIKLFEPIYFNAASSRGGYQDGLPAFLASEGLPLP